MNNNQYNNIELPQTVEECHELIGKLLELVNRQKEDINEMLKSMKEMNDQNQKILSINDELISKLSIPQPDIN